MGNSGLVVGGGIIRNENGGWVKGYARAIGVTTSVVVELWALKDGLWLYISLKLPTVEIELDAKVVIDLVGKETSNPNSIDTIVADCEEGLKEIPFVRIKHCCREANKCADALARQGALLAQDFIIFIQPPLEVELLLSLDASGTMYDRFVTSPLEAA